MKRMYRALIWLAVVAVIAGLVSASIYAFSLFHNGNGIGYGTTGFTGSLPDWLEFFGVGSFFAVTNTLVAGVVVLGMALAWADHRRGWLIAVLLVTIAVILWPQAQHLWLLTHPSLVPPPVNTSVTPSLSDDLTVFSAYAVSLAPVLLLLVFALIRRKSATSATSDAASDLASDADDALGITRSAL